jgi:hypothetical protein
MLEAFKIEAAPRKLFTLMEEEGPYWTICDGCAETTADCTCVDSMRYYAEYDDEASYD